MRGLDYCTTGFAKIIIKQLSSKTFRSQSHSPPPTHYDSLCPFIVAKIFWNSPKIVLKIVAKIFWNRGQWYFPGVKNYSKNQNKKNAAS